MLAAPAWSAVAALVEFELELGAGAPVEDPPAELDGAPLVGPGAPDEEDEVLELLPPARAFAAAWKAS